jgi:hypothetical protein
MKNQKEFSFSKKVKIQFSLLTILLLAFSLVMVSCEKDDPDPNTEDDNEDPVTTVDEYEPNNERSEAYTIDLDTKYNSEIGEVTDDDWFKITPSHGNDTYDKVQISVTDVSTDLFIHIELYSADGASLATHGTTTEGQSLTYTFATPGVDYYVRFSGWSGYASDHNSSGSYSFTVSNLDANDDFAPNHTIETAEESLEYGSSYNGVIVSKYEDDYYKFTNPTPGSWNSYTFTLTDVSDGLFGKFNIYGADKSELDSKGSTTAGADLSYTFISKEDVFYVRVSGWSGYASDHNSSGSYTFTPTSNGNDDNEPDDTFDNAREIISFPTDNLAGTILIDAANDNNGDYEFFKVTIPDGKKIEWSVDPEASNTELHFNVYDAYKDYLGNEDGSDGQTINGSMNNTSGAESYFYIKLGGYVGDNGNYTISFTETNAD